MIRRPEALAVDVTVRDVRASFADGHVAIVLLTEDGVLRGTLAGRRSA